MKKYFTLPVFLVSFMLFLLACAGSAAAPTPDQLATIVALTLTSVAMNLPPATATPDISAATVAPTSVPTIAAAGTHYVYTSADNVNLRVNPGRSFQVSRVLPKGSRLQVLGSAPGREWFNVLNEEGIIGWVGADFVSGGYDGPPPPIVIPTNVQVVSGRVLDANGNPVTGIRFSISQNTLREDAATEETGTFYAYLPTKFSGAWNVSYLSIACASNTMGSNCQCLNGACGKPNPETVSITLPLSTPLNFIWR